jgi:glycosyltransferase involved in cell wall biosynthesis
VDVIYSSASPISAHLVAGLIHRATGVPWVAEFRDPWIGNVLAAPLPWPHRRVQTRLERWIVRSATRLVFLSTETAGIYERRYPDLRGRAAIVPNGYDASELGVPPVRRPPGERFLIVYTGTLERPAEAAAFLAGVDLLAARRPELAKRLDIEFVGHVGTEVEELAAPYIRAEPTASIIRFTAYAPREIALDRVRAADACLVLLGDEPGMSQFLPGKLLDYIGLDAPVLAVVPDGEARTLLRDLDWGITVDPTPDGVADGLERLLRGEHRVGRADPMGRFERRRLAAALGDVFDQALGISG